MDACDAYVPEPKKVNKCEACRTVARDIYWGMALWDIPEISPSSVSITLQSTCLNLGLHHSPWFKLEPVCTDLMDDYAADVTRSILIRNEHWDRVKRVSTKGSSGEWLINPETTTVDNICNKVLHVCHTPSIQTVPPGGWLKPAADDQTPFKVEEGADHVPTATTAAKQEL